MPRSAPRPPSRSRFASLRVCSPARSLALGLLASLVLAAPARADEGQWMPSQIAELDQARLRELGLELAPEQLWNGEGGLMRAAVNLSGCSAAFISADGLIATNHHCAYGAIQANSSVEHDYLKDGFVARSREQELPGKDLSVRVLERIDDVTAQVQAAADAAPDDRARAQAIDRARKQIVDECEKSGPALRCEVATFYSGSQYQRFTYRELRDVRLVYAPPAAIGEFGGEIDNWMWPRHTGDFSLLRAYAGADNQAAEPAASNVPYKPAQWLRPAHTGVKPGDFVAVLGYPGVTQRYLPVIEAERYIDQVFPARIDLYGEWIAIFEALGGRDPAVGIKVAASKKSLANRHKNAEGMIAGLRAMQLVERRKAEEAALEQWALRPENAGYADVLPEIRALSQERRDGFAGEFLLESLGSAGNLLGGEQSGHLIWSDFARTGDGIAGALLTLQALGETRLEDFYAFDRLPQRLVNVKIRSREEIPTAARFQAAVQEESAKLEGRGRVVVRPSGTELLVRIMVEAPEPEECESVVNRLAEIAEAEIGA